MSKTTTVATVRPLSVIAADIRRDWARPYFGAVPYLDALAALDGVNDRYGFDTGAELVARFLANAGTWKGDTARAVKAELRQALKHSGRA